MSGRNYGRDGKCGKDGPFGKCGKDGPSGKNGCDGKPGPRGYRNKPVEYHSKPIASNSSGSESSDDEMKLIKVRHVLLLEEHQHIEAQRKRVLEEERRLVKAESDKLAMEVAVLEQLRRDRDRQLDAVIDNEDPIVVPVKEVVGQAGCCICLDGPRDTVLIPCGHKHFCYSCIEMYCKDPVKTCPICKVKITTYAKVFE